MNTNYGDATAVQGGDGKWTITISANPFDRRKALFQQNAPSMVSSSANFYPAEAVVVFYSVVANDHGYGGAFPPETRQSLSNLTGMDMTSEYLYGSTGYLVRRPLDTFLVEQAMSQFFTELGF